MTERSYGWYEADSPESCSYIAPEIINICTGLGVNKIIDIGCGNGALIGTLKSKGFKLAGVEYDKKGYLISKKSHPEFNFYNLGVEDEPVKILSDNPEKFDCAISTEVIEHLYSPQLLPIFAGKVLNDGYLIISTPYHGYFKNLLLSIFDYWDKHHTTLWEGGHIKFWSKKTIKVLLENNGFKVIGFKGTGRIPFLWKSMIIIAKRK